MYFHQLIVSTKERILSKLDKSAVILPDHSASIKVWGGRLCHFLDHITVLPPQFWHKSYLLLLLLWNLENIIFSNNKKIVKGIIDILRIFGMSPSSP
jgi:hypothetical protein